MIHNLVFQNADEPASLWRTSTELFVTAYGGEIRFLHQVLCHFGFAYTHQSVSVKTLTVLVHPSRCRLKICGAHKGVVTVRTSEIVLPREFGRSDVGCAHIVRGVCVSTLVCRSKAQNLTSRRKSTALDR
jgi:hypothetical protein